MAVIYRVFQLSSRLYLQKGLQNVATPCVVSVVNHNAVSARSFASLPNICRRKLSEYSLRTEQSVAGRMPRTFGVLGFTQGFMQQQVGFASAPPTFSRQRREEKDEDKWYSSKLSSHSRVVCDKHRRTHIDYDMYKYSKLSQDEGSSVDSPCDGFSLLKTFFLEPTHCAPGNQVQTLCGMMLQTRMLGRRGSSCWEEWE